MSIANTNQWALAQKPNVRMLRWVEIEGLPYAYGNRDLPQSFYTPIAGTRKDFFGVIGGFQAGYVPAGSDVRLNQLDGFASRPGEFEFRIANDQYGYIAAAAAVGRYAAARGGVASALSASGGGAAIVTTAYTPGSNTLAIGLANGSYWPNSAVIGWVGRMAFFASGYSGTATAGTITGFIGGMLRSEDAAQAVGSPVATFPMHLGRRRLWYYVAAANTDPLGNDTFSVLERVAVFGGTISDYRYEAGVWIIKARTAEGDLGLGNAGGNAKLFRTLRSGKTKTALPGGL